ncbi:MAG: hypothetical protein K2P93_05190 [Alphaproteobacteria bacterium]|nr:hypothetical protein [Alphaproteobacteria bacterium]
MLKKGLSTSVSALVILGALSSFDSSYAMQGEDGDNKKPSILSKFRALKKRTKSSLTPVSSPSDPESTRIEHMLMPLGAPKTLTDPLVEFPTNSLPLLGKSLLGHICCFLDPNTTLKAELVCKGWHQISYERKQAIQKNLSAKTITPMDLRNSLLHPLTLHWMLSEVASRFPYQPLNLRPAEGAEIRGEDLPPDSIRLLDDWAGAITQVPECHDFLCRIFMNLCPMKDMKTVGIAARLLERVPALQQNLLSILQRTPFEMAKFLTLKDSQKHTSSIHKHMKALKLLALSGDEGAKARMLEFINTYGAGDDDLPDAPYLLTSSLFLNYETRVAVTSCVLWSKFTDDSSLLKKTFGTLEDELTCLDTSDVRIGVNIDLEEMRKFTQYVLSLPLSLQTTAFEFFNDVLGPLYKLQCKEIPPLQEEDMLKTPKTLREKFYKVIEYYNFGQYGKANEIINMLLESTPVDSPVCFLFRLALVDNLLKENNPEKILQVQECLELLKAQMGDKPTLEVFLDEKETPILIHRSHLYARQAAFDILQGNFDKVDASLATVFLPDNEENEQNLKFLLPILQVELGSIPDEFFKRMRSNKTLQEEINSLDEDIVLLYVDVLAKMQKGVFKRFKLRGQEKKIAKMRSQAEKQKKKDPKSSGNGKSDKK